MRTDASEVQPSLNDPQDRPVTPQQPQEGSAFPETAPLVDITFRAHSPQEAAANPRVPLGITAVCGLRA